MKRLPLAAAACCVFLLLGMPAMRAAQPTPPPNQPDPPGLHPDATTEPTPLPAPAPTPDPAVVKEVAGLKTADALWGYIKKWSNLEDIQPDSAAPPEKQIAQARAAVDDKIIHLQSALPAFLKDYPKDPHWWDAKLVRLFFLRDVEKISDEQATAGLREIADAKDAPADTRQQARGVLLENAVQGANPEAGLTDALEKEFSSYEKDFPDDSNGARFVTLRLRFLGPAAPEKIVALLKTLVASPNHATADAAKTQLALRTEPLDTKLTATDGQEIDLAKLRGKVVLLDFWATWCVPCMMKMPEVLAVAKKYDPKDFQIVGISFDEDKEALAKVVKNKGLTWPQVHDPKGFEGSVAGKFGVEVIPTAWLIDRKGYAHPLGLDADLDEEVGKLVSQK